MTTISLFLITIRNNKKIAIFASIEIDYLWSLILDLNKLSSQDLVLWCIHFLSQQLEIFREIYSLVRIRLSMINLSCCWALIPVRPWKYLYTIMIHLDSSWIAYVSFSPGFQLNFIGFVCEKPWIRYLSRWAIQGNQEVAWLWLFWQNFNLR